MEKELFNLFNDELSKESIKLLRVSYQKEDDENVLFVVIDEEEVTMELCMKVIEIINPILDSYDGLDEEYDVEVRGKEVNNE